MPRDPARSAAWTAVLLIMAVVMMGVSDTVYASGWITVLLIGILAISWVPMNFWAVVMERRTLINPKGQFWRFYFGDLLFLPGAMACFAALESNLGNKGWEPQWWFDLCVATALGLGFLFHYVVDHPKPNGYSASQWHSPTKLWHDFYVMPVFQFYLAIKLPLLWSSVAWTGTVGWSLSIYTLLFVALWAALMNLDGARKPSPLSTAHVNYDWTKLRPVKA